MHPLDVGSALYKFLYHTTTQNISVSYVTKQLVLATDLKSQCLKYTNNYEWYLTPWRKNPKVHHRTHNSPPPVPVLSQSNPIHTPQASLPKIHSNPIFPPTPWSSKSSPSLGISPPNLVYFSLLSHACHMPRPPHSP
jgi:hypothetical protein